MTIDWFTLDALIRELAPQLAGARIDKIHQPGRDRLLLRLWNGRDNLRLVLDLTAGAARLHLTPTNEVNPAVPPRFCQLLRARLRRLERVELAPADRIVSFLCRGEAGEAYRLVMEMTGARTELVLVDGAGQVVDALHRRQDDHRSLTAGAPYQPPVEPAGLRLDAADSASFAAVEPPLAPWLLRHLRPMTPLLAEEAALRVAAGEGLPAVLADFAARSQAGCYQPLLALFQGRPWPVPLVLARLELPQSHRCSNFSELVAALYEPGEAAPPPADERQRLKTVVNRALARCRRRLVSIDAEAAEATRAEGWQHWGQLLLGQFHQLRRGLESVELTDWFADPPVPVTIPLDPKLGPQENAERYFTRARKLKRGEQHRQRRQSETAEEIEWLEQMLLALEEAGSGEELQLIRDELEQARLVPTTTRRGPKARPRSEQLRRSRTPGGWALVWGTSGRVNDLLLRGVAKPHDLWFHAHAIPGCHLVLQRRPDEAVPEADRLYAAAVAAGYSSARDDARVEVLVSEVRQLKFVKGGAPGKVTVAQFTTVRVAPLRLEGPAG